MAFDVASPGQYVVPLSTIIDQLQGKLTSAEIDALVQAIIGARKDKVAPGDLITADLLNQILTDVAALQVAVAKLQAGQTPDTGNGVVITSPTAATVARIGDALVIRGQNLLSNSIVMIENTSIGGLIGSSDNTTLTIPKIPPIDVLGGVVEAGTTVTLTVSNSKGQKDTELTLKPAIMAHPSGDMVITQSSTEGTQDGTTFDAGGTYDFVFNISADINPDTTFLVTPTIGRSGWTATADKSEILIVHAADAEHLTSAKVKVTVKIADTASEGDTGSLYITLTAKNYSTMFFRSTPEIPIAVGQQSTQAPTLAFAMTTVTAGDAGTGVVDGKTTGAIGQGGGKGGTGQLNFSVTRTDNEAFVEGDYTVDLAALAELSTQTDGVWSASLAGTGGNTVTLTAAKPTVGISITVKDNANPAQLHLKLAQANDANVFGDQMFDLILMPG